MHGLEARLAVGRTRVVLARFRRGVHVEVTGRGDGVAARLDEIETVRHGGLGSRRHQRLEQDRVGGIGGIAVHVVGRGVRAGEEINPARAVSRRRARPQLFHGQRGKVHHSLDVADFQLVHEPQHRLQQVVGRQAGRRDDGLAQVEIGHESRDAACRDPERPVDLEARFRAARDVQRELLAALEQDVGAVAAVLLGDHLQAHPLVLAGIHRQVLDQVEGGAVLVGEQIDLARRGEVEGFRRAVRVQLDAREDDHHFGRTVHRRVADPEVESAGAVAAAARAERGRQRERAGEQDAVPDALVHCRSSS